MDVGTQEATREYRISFANRDAGWDDPIPTEVTSAVLGREATSVISRTGLLAESLVNMPQVDMADLTDGGSIEIVVMAAGEFDESAFKTEVAEIVAGVRQVRSHAGGWRRPTTALAGPVVIETIRAGARAGTRAVDHARAGRRSSGRDSREVDVNDAVAIARDAGDFLPHAQIGFDLVDAPGIRPEVHGSAAVVQLLARASRSVIGRLELMRGDDGDTPKARGHVGEHGAETR